MPKKSYPGEPKPCHKLNEEHRSVGTDMNQRTTLLSLLATLPLLDRVFILHRMGPHELEAVGGGTVRELKAFRCAEACGDNIVEGMDLVTDESESEWMNMDTPVRVITIGRKLVTARVQKGGECDRCQKRVTPVASG